MTTAELTAIAAELESSLAYKLGWGRVVRPTRRLRALLAKNTSTTFPPPTPASRPRVKGALIVNAGNANPDLLRQAGITHVAPELTPANIADLRTSRWDGLARGGFYISRVPGIGAGIADTMRGQAADAAGWAGTHRLTHLVVDTEAHKADSGGRREWTEELYAELRRLLGPAFPLYNVTYGIHSSPAVVNHDAFRRHNVTPIWEAYDAAGRTLGVGTTAAKAAAEGWRPPHVAVGDKSVREDVQTLVALKSSVGDVWLWAPEQAGTDVLAFQAIA